MTDKKTKKEPSKGPSKLVTDPPHPTGGGGLPKGDYSVGGPKAT